MGGEVGHVEFAQQLLGRRGVVIGGPADQREAGERDHRVHQGLPVAAEVALHRRPGVQSAGEGGDDPEPACLQRRDDAVVMIGIAREHVGAHHQQPDGAVAAVGLRQAAGILAHALLHTRMVDAYLGVLRRQRRLHPVAQAPARSAGITADQKAHHVGHVVVRTGQPVLQREEVGPDVLGGAGDETQDLGQPAQHRHLARAGGAAATFGLLRFQLLQERERSLLATVHAEVAKLRKPCHLGRRHAAHQGVAAVPARAQLLDDGLDVIVHEHHGDHDDVGAGDVLPAAGQRIFVGRPLGGHVQVHGQAGQFTPEHPMGALDGARHVTVERQHDEVDRRVSRFSGRSVLWHRTASRR